jgi:hypothetical protein
VKSHGREVATRVFERKADAVAWQQDQQRRRLRLGEWIDPRRGQVPLSVVAADWLSSRGSVKRRTRETDEAAWRNYVQPRFGNWPVASITAAEVSSWVGSLVARGLAPSTATRALATLRSILAFAVADGRVQHNVAAAARKPTSGHARREGQALTLAEIASLTEACKGRYRDVVTIIALAGLRWGELAGLQVGDRVWAPGPGLRPRPVPRLSHRPRLATVVSSQDLLWPGPAKACCGSAHPGLIDLHVARSTELRERRECRSIRTGQHSRAELDALKAELKRLRREIGRGASHQRAARQPRHLTPSGRGPALVRFSRLGMTWG